MRTKSHRQCYPPNMPPAFMAPVQNIPTVDQGGPIGPRGVAFLRRVRGARGPYRLCRNADREALDRALSVRFVKRDPRDKEVVHLTDAGAAYLDRLMRVE